MGAGEDENLKIYLVWPKPCFFFFSLLVKLAKGL